MNKSMLNTVVVPWDFSPMSKSGLEVALAMVDDPAKIEVIHVLPYPTEAPYGTNFAWLNHDNLREEMTQLFQKNMSDAGAPELKFTAMFGDPGIVITDFAKSKKATLVVISSHGHTGLSRLLLGSVAERVVRLSPCPVLVLRGDGEETE